MSEPRVVQADFANWRPVAGRKVLQLVFEVPIEQTELVMTMLGVPMPGESKWCAIALLEKGAPKERKGIVPQETPFLEKVTKDRRPFASLPLSQQAALRCNDMGQFYDFLMERNPQLSDFVSWDAAQEVRDICGVSSRSELDTNDLAAAKWRKLEADFQAYLTTERYSGQIK